MLRGKKSPQHQKRREVHFMTFDKMSPIIQHGKQEGSGRHERVLCAILLDSVTNNATAQTNLGRVVWAAGAVSPPRQDACPLFRTAGCVRWKEDIMAAHGEWNRKGATLSDVTAKAEYGVSRDCIVQGIQTGKLEYREGSIWGNPYLRVLRSQLEHYIAEELGEDYVLKVKNQTELHRVKKEISALKKRLAGLQERQKELEASLDK